MNHAATDPKQIFLEAVEHHAPENWVTYLDRACGDDLKLRRRVEGLLAAHRQANSLLDGNGIPAIVAFGAIAERPGSVIGPYKLMEEIGEGGMGLVFVAEQQHPVRRKVALKVIKPGMDSREIISRFEAERQALALMDHPNIAKVLDAGTTGESGLRTQRSGVSGDSADDGPLTPLRCVRGSGRPYFVMELVKGVPITEHCDQHQLGTRERLELFLQVCHAVQHAHQKGIIHRDLKPSNVLVTMHDATPLVKVIDFGVAKAIGQQLTDKTLYTGIAQMLGTPLYMSPEQAGQSSLDVDTRSDVYSLGVLLYELLTGTTPFDSETLRKVGFDEMRRIIREDEPPRPSQRVSTLHAGQPSTISGQRHIDPHKLSHQLHGELDWIVMKCLEKDRTRRYESASAFAADVQRYLNDAPVEACPPSAVYRLRKYARRNRRYLSTAAVIAAALVAATAVSTWQAVLARDAQRQAETDRDLAKVAQHQAEADRERATVAEKKAGSDAAIATAINNFLQGDMLRQVNSVPLTDDAPDAGGNLTVREALDRAAASIGDRFQDQPLVEAAIRSAIGDAYRSVAENRLAVPHLERALELRKAQLAVDHRDTIGSMFSLAMAYEWVGRLPDAIAIHEQVLAKRSRLLGSDHPDTLGTVNSLANACRLAGLWDRALKLNEQSLETMKATLGPDHPHTLGGMHGLGLSYRETGRFPEAIAILDQVLKKTEALFGPDHPSTLYCMNAYAVTCQRAGKLDEADRVLRDSLARRRNRHDPQWDGGTANTLAFLGLNLLLQDQYDAAEPLIREALALYGPNQLESWRPFDAMSLLGAALFGQGNYVEAEPLLLKGYEGMKQHESTIFAQHKHRLSVAVERLVRFYEVTQQPENARAWREKLSAETRPDRESI